ncbi:MAG: PspC domain-containing protein [Treponema sp.]|nr:PspC domain-containing protein [Treponema sp.]
MTKKLYKSNKNKMICGVCGGLAEFFNIDATIVRLIFALLVILHGAGFLLYIFACIVMPRSLDYSDSENMDDEDINNLKSANMEDEKSAKKEKSGLHSDEEFDTYFRKKC